MTSRRVGKEEIIGIDKKEKKLRVRGEYFWLNFLERSKYRVQRIPAKKIIKFPLEVPIERIKD